MIALGEGGQDDYSTCSHCVFAGSSGRVYIATAGTLFLDNDSDQAHGYPQGALLNVTLREATVDETTLETTIVPQGTCLYLESQSIDIDPVGTWTECPPEYQEDEQCDCGCGDIDSACESEPRAPATTAFARMTAENAPRAPSTPRTTPFAPPAEVRAPEHLSRVYDGGGESTTAEDVTRRTPRTLGASAAVSFPRLENFFGRAEEHRP